MKAYIHTAYNGGRGFDAELVDEQDYHERGPHALSYRTPIYQTEREAREEAIAWAKKMNYTLVNGPEEF